MSAHPTIPRTTGVLSDNVSPENGEVPPLASGCEALDSYARKALRESEEKFAKVFRACPDAISVHELETGRYLDANESFFRMFGYTREQVIGRTALELDIWADPAEREAFVARLRRDSSVRDFQARVRLASGEIHSCELSAETIEIDGRPHNVTVLRDIAAHLRAEQALRESEEKFATAFRVSPDIVSISEYDTGRYLEVNETHERVFGFSREESIGRSPLELGILPDPATRAEMLRRLERDGRLIDFTVHARTRQGQPLVLSLSAEVIELGGKKCILRHSRDITAARAAEQALRESEEKFAKAFRSSSHSLTISELATGRYLDVNTGFELLSGYTREKVIGRTSVELGLWHDPADRDELVRRLCRDGVVRDMEIKFHARDGRVLTTLSSCEIVELEGRSYILNAIKDITDERHAEQEKMLLEAQLRQSQKLEALGILAGGIAHDFNNILTAIVLNQELALLDADDPALVRRYLSEVSQATKRAKDLVRQILTFSRQQSHQERGAVQLAEVVQEVMRLLRASLPATIEIVTTIDPGTPLVLADASQIHQVVMNLGVNAAHAMRARPGRLSATLAPRLVDEALARSHPKLRPGLYVQFSMSDTGHGMDADVLAHIFEPFFTTKAHGEGTGLGLAVVHGIIEDHGGAILVRSAPEEGTTFDLFFPSYVKAGSATEGHKAAPPRGRGESVLVIDDEKSLCEAIRTMLEKLGYRVTAFSDPVAAVGCFRTSPAAFDLLVTDHTMPRLTGLEVIREVQQVRPAFPALLLSGYSSACTPEALRGLDVRELVAKPLDHAGLAQAVRRALDHQQSSKA